jgi:hypothetical protein
MTLDEFRRIALAQRGASEGAHMGHSDFRVKGKIFATIPDAKRNRGMVVLSPEEQAEFMQEAPDVFSPAAGAWGRRGCTYIALDGADPDAVGRAVHAAWRAKAT